MRMISYAQNFEDVILNRIFKNKKSGHYIDIGAYDPIIHSVTKHFYGKGWNGINVEPLPKFYKKLKKERKQDYNLQYVVTNKDNETKTLFYNEDIEQSSIKYKVKSNKSIKCNTISLTSLFTFYTTKFSNKLDFLKIDAEGSEPLIINNADWYIVRPIVIVVEATKPISQKLNYTDWEFTLLQNNYLFVYFDGLNRWYLSKEQEDKKKYFTAPPNVFDTFVKYYYNYSTLLKDVKMGNK